MKRYFILTMFYQIFNKWRKYLSDSGQKQNVIFILIFTLVNALIFSWFIRVNEHRVGIRFSEPLIDYILPVADFTWYIFSLTYLHIAFAIILLIQIPVEFIKALQAYNFLLIFRLLCISLVPLDAPVNIIPMKDPIVETLSAYDGFIYKDLFFSGHTATLFLLGLMMKNKFLKIYYWVIACIVAFLLVKQQVHYSIDVVAAPFFAYICFYITHVYWKRKTTNINYRKKLIILLMLISPFCVTKAMSQQKNKKQPIVIAHRGASAYAPENTLAAIKKALAMGVDMVEIDVQLTIDKQIVLMHDLTVDRTTNGKGRVRDLSFEEIRKLDAGSWFSSEYEGEKVPTLEEVFETIKGKCKLLIEVKRVKTKKPEIEAKIVQLIHKYNAQNWCIVQSFETKVLKNLQALDSSIECHKLVTKNISFLPLHLDSRIKIGTIYKYKTVQAINPNFKMLSKRKVDKIHSRRQKIFTWTVNEKKDMKRMIDMGVDGIITNYPDRLIELLKIE